MVFEGTIDFALVFIALLGSYSSARIRPAARPAARDLTWPSTKTAKPLHGKHVWGKRIDGKWSGYNVGRVLGVTMLVLGLKKCCF